MVKSKQDDFFSGSECLSNKSKVTPKVLIHFFREKPQKHTNKSDVVSYRIGQLADGEDDDYRDEAEGHLVLLASSCASSSRHLRLPVP